MSTQKKKLPNACFYVGKKPGANSRTQTDRAPAFDLPRSLANAMAELTEALIDRFINRGFVKSSAVTGGVHLAGRNEQDEHLKDLHDDITSLLGRYVLDSARYQTLSRMIGESLSQEISVEDPVGTLKVSSMVDRSHPVVHTVVSLSWISSRFEISVDEDAVTPPSRDPVLGDRLVSGRSRKDSDHTESIDFEEVIDSIILNEYEVEQSAWCHCKTKT